MTPEAFASFTSCITPLLRGAAIVGLAEVREA